MHAGIALAKAFPPCPLDQPASRQFDQAITSRIADQIGTLGANALGQLERNQRILEEAAGITQLGGIWQLFAADGADRSTDIGGGRHFDAHLRKALAHRAVVKAQCSQTAQAETYAQDQPAPGFALE